MTVNRQGRRDGETTAGGASQHRAILLKTLAHTVMIAAAAVVVDFLVHRVFTHNAAAFTPLATAGIAVLVGGPVDYFLTYPQAKLRRAGAALAAGAAQMDRVVSELVQRREESEQARNVAQQAMERLAESEALYRLMTDQMSDIVIRYDRDGVIEFASPSVRQFGYEPTSLIGRNMADFSHVDDEPNAIAIRKAVVQSGYAPDGAAHAVRAWGADGALIWLEGRPSPISNDAGETIGVVTVLRDVTARRAMEDELRLKRAEAELAVAAKSEFLANMTHELRTPLNAIVGFSGLLKKSGALTQGDQRRADLIYDAGQTLLHVVNDVLDYSKLEAGAIDLETLAFDPAAIAGSITDILGVQAAEKGLAIAVKVEGERQTLLGDGARLRQVLLNLVSNAIKFTARGGVEVLVRQAAVEGGQRLEIEVSDTGIGLRPEQLETIFARFTQADASISRKFGGTGLGLAISRCIVEAMGGTIGVRSIEGQGATFWISLTLPLADGLAVEGHDAVDITGPSQPLRLLVVEDNMVNQELIVALLSPFDLSIVTAADGVEAVEAASREDFDLILMDIQMPNMDGLTATRRIRADCPAARRQPPIIAMTANVMPDQIARCLAAGMDDHIGKPIDPARLLQVLERWSSTESAAVGAQTESAAG